MTIEQRIREILSEWELREARPEGLRRLQEFYSSMKEKGLIRKNEYSIPPLDTVGRGANTETQSRANERRVTRD